MINPEINPEINPVINPEINPVINPVMNPVINPVMNTLINEKKGNPRASRGIRGALPRAAARPRPKAYAPTAGSPEMQAHRESPLRLVRGDEPHAEPLDRAGLLLRIRYSY